MIPRVVKAEYITDYKIYLRFADGAEGEVNLTAELEDEIFEPLKDRNFLYDKVKVVV